MTLRSLAASLALAIAATGVAPAEEPRSYEATALQKAWDSTKPEELRDKFPPGAYRISGKVAELINGNVYLKAGGKKNAEIKLRMTDDAKAAAAKLKKGAAVTALCEFHGVS